MLSLSASRIKLYLSCRATYYDNYVLRNEQPTNTSALFGSALHKAIEYKYKYAGNGITRPIKGNPQIVFSRYMQRMYDYWNKAGKDFKEYESFMDLLKTGRQILKDFPWDDFNPIAQELDFDIPFSEHTRMKGYIDMIDTGGFVDFKSSKKPSASLQTDIQFIIYAWAYHQLYNRWPTSGIWYHLRTNETYIFSVEQKDIELTIDALKETAEMIYNDTFETVLPCAKCTPWCKFKGLKKDANISQR